MTEGLGTARASHRSAKTISALVVAVLSGLLTSCAFTGTDRHFAAEHPGASAAAPESRFIGKPDQPGDVAEPVASVVVPNRIVEPTVRYDEAARAFGDTPELIEPIRPKRALPPDSGVRGVGRFIGIAPPSSAPAPGAVDAALSKNLDSTFLGSDFDNNTTVTGGNAFIPPDNHIAVGPGHLVTVTNVAIQIHTKAATPTRVLNQSLRTFFGSLSVPANNFTFDPKVVYDNASGRFVVMTMEVTDNGTGPGTSRLLIAASQGSDPTTGTWRFTAINSNVAIGGINHWADYPGFAVDEEAIYISSNLFRYQFQGFNYGGARLWIIPKTPFYAGTAFTLSLIDPYLGLTPGAATTLLTRMVGTPPGTTGIWLTSAGWSSGANDAVRVLRIDSPLGTPAINSQFVNLGDVDSSLALANAPQLGDPAGATIDAGDRRSHDALWRSDNLWMSFTTNPGSGVDAGQSTVRWVRIGTTNPAALTLLDQGAIGGESIASATHTYYGNLGVNAQGRVVIGFSASAATTRPGAHYAVRLPGDAVGTTRAPLLLRAGEGYYFRDFGGGSNRWGDYSGAAVDEANGCVWLYNQFAQTPSASSSGGTGRWGTVGGRVCPGLQTTLAINGTSANPSVAGQPVTVTVTVTETVADALDPNGNVTVTASTGESCVVTLPANTCSIVFTAPGSPQLTATYAGDGNFNASTSPTRSQTVGPASTQIALSAQSVNPSVVGQSVSFPFALSVVAPGAGTPSGTVTVNASTGESCTATLPASTCAIVFNTVGSRNVSARYPGSASFALSMSAARSHVVNPAGSTTTLSSSTPNPSTPGQSVSVTWSVAVNPPGSSALAGLVTVTASGGSETCQAALPATSCAITLTVPGARTLTASFGGSATVAASAATIAHVVTAQADTVFSDSFEP